MGTMTLAEPPVPEEDEPRKRPRMKADLSLEDRNKQLVFENRRLRAEVDSLRKKVERLTGGLPSSDMPIVVKKALNLAGYWNVHPNDVLVIAPRLAEEFERETKICPLHPNGKTVCFPPMQRERVIELVIRLMPELMPKYRRHV